MKLRNRKSHVTRLPEGEAPASRGSWLTKWFYYLLLLAIAGYAGWHLLDYILYVEVRGQIEVEKTRLAPPRGGIVERIAVLEGQRVTAGEVLAVIGPEQACPPQAPPRLDKLELDLAMDRRRLTLLERELAEKQDRLAGLDLRRALELDEERRREARDLRRELEDLRADARLLESEIELKAESLRAARAEVGETPPECLALTVRAPFAGRVTAVLLRPHEYLRRGQTLFMLTPDDGPVRVEAYPEQEDTTRWYEGAAVTVLLPDGGRTLGRVAELRSAAYEAADREREDYVPVESRPRVHVLPPDDATADLWRRFDRMEVHVRQER